MKNAIIIIGLAFLGLGSYFLVDNQILNGYCSNFISAIMLWAAHYLNNDYED